MKKGFTLVELLAVIVIIAAVALVVFPIVTGHINDSKEKLCLVQVKDIEDAAKKWATENNDKLDKYHINDVYVSVDYLKYQKYLEKDVIIEPKTKEKMNGCVLIHYDINTKQYKYEYMQLDLTKSEDVNKIESDAFIYYYYDDDTMFENVENKDHEKKPFYEKLLDSTIIRVDGENEAGLYDLGDNYVYRGSNVNNYIKYGGNTYRILSIDKNDYSMKLISTTAFNAGEWSENELDFTKTNLKDTLKLSSTPLLNTNWYTGEVTNKNLSIDELDSELSDPIDVEVGLISLYDYVAASLDSACYDNISSDNCANNNYLHTMLNNGSKGVWTITTDGVDQVWVINSSGKVDIAPPSSQYYYFRVIKVPINVYTNTNKTGSSDNPYELTYNLVESNGSKYCESKKNGSSSNQNQSGDNINEPEPNNEPEQTELVVRATSTNTPSTAQNGYLKEQVWNLITSGSPTGYYLKSTREAKSNIGFTKSCGSGIEPSECTDITSTTTMTANTWYYSASKPTITYDIQSTETSTLYTKVTDGTNSSMVATATVSKIDRTAPTVNLGNVELASNAVSITVVSSDSDSGLSTPTCKYSTTSGSYTTSATATSSRCTINNANSDTTYYYKYCANDKVGNQTCKTGNSKTTELAVSASATNTPSSSQNGFYKEQTWSLTTSGNPTGYYIKSTRVATSSVNLTKSCSTGTDPTTCTNITGTTSMTANTWYYTESKPSITYNTTATATATLYVRVTDGTNTTGNATATVSKIDRTAPTVTLGTATTDSSSITVPVTVSETETSLGTPTCKYSTTNGSYTTTATATTSSCSITGLNESTHYYYEYCVSDSVGNEKCERGDSETSSAGPPVPKYYAFGTPTTSSPTTIPSGRSIYATLYTDGAYGLCWGDGTYCVRAEKDSILPALGLCPMSSIQIYQRNIYMGVVCRGVPDDDVITFNLYDDLSLVLLPDFDESYCYLTPTTVTCGDDRSEGGFLILD